MDWNSIQFFYFVCFLISCTPIHSQSIVTKTDEKATIEFDWTWTSGDITYSVVIPAPSSFLDMKESYDYCKSIGQNSLIVKKSYHNNCPCKYYFLN